MSKIFCSIRREWVAALPEELVRQRVLTHMVAERGFPPSLIAVEIPLKQLPHLSAQERSLVPDRRADVVCFAKETAGLFPLLLIECKAIQLSSRVVNQVVGYHHYVRSRFIAIVNQSELRLGWYNEGRSEYLFINHLPDYQELNNCISLS